MRSNFVSSLPFTLKYEGGYSNNRADRGGPTMKGITWRTYNAYRTLVKKPVQSVKLITDAEVQAIYKTQYWDKIDADDMPQGIDFAIFDEAVNSGPSLAIKYAQIVLVKLGHKEVKVDSRVGPITLHALSMVDPEAFIKLFCTDRVSFLRRLSNWSTFGKGWRERVMGDFSGTKLVQPGVIQVAIGMLHSTLVGQIAA